jgi:hypothetical protein
MWNSWGCISVHKAWNDGRISSKRLRETVVAQAMFCVLDLPAIFPCFIWVCHATVTVTSIYTKYICNIHSIYNIQLKFSLYTVYIYLIYMPLHGISMVYVTVMLIHTVYLRYTWRGIQHSWLNTHVCALNETSSTHLWGVGGYNLRPVRLFLSPNLYSAVLIIFFAPRFHINHFLLFSVMGVSPENFGFPPCERDFFLYRNLFTSAN